MLHNTKSTLYRTEREREREAKAPEYCSQKAELPCMCECMNENAASLQPADHQLSGSPGRGEACARPSVHVDVFYKVVCILTRRYAEGSTCDAGVNPLTHSLNVVVPKNYNK